jgi:phage terminase small subunit
MTKHKLTPRQTRFCEEYVKDLNASAAYRRSGYSATGHAAEANAARLLRNAEVAAAIAAAMVERSHRTEVSADRVIAELAKVAFADPRKLFDANGVLKPLDQIDDDTRAALVIEVTQGTDADGNPTFARKVKFADKLVALDKLARHLGLFVDKVKISGDAESPIMVMIQRINSQGSSIRPVIEGVVEEYGRAA